MVDNFKTIFFPQHLYTIESIFTEIKKFCYSDTVINNMHIDKLMTLGKEKLLQILRRGQVNLLVYGPDRPYFKQKQKIMLQNFGQLAFFLIYYFLLFEKKRKEKSITNLYK